MPEVTIKAAVAAMPREYTHCRDYGHDWRPFDVREAGRMYERTLRCTRCQTHCHQMVAKRNGRLTGGRRYTYPTDYLIPGLGSFSSEDRGLVRLASIKDDMSIKDDTWKGR